jgi:hypothetical protein
LSLTMFPMFAMRIGRHSHSRHVYLLMARNWTQSFRFVEALRR